MERQSLDLYLQEHICLYKHLGLQLMGTERSHVHFRASLSQNWNHKGTAFGGSIYAIAILTAYTSLLSTLRNASLTTENIVVANAEIRYLKPIDGDFDSFCELSIEQEQMLSQQLRSQGRVRQNLTVQVHCNTVLCVELKGLFVVKNS